jgi:hypothetical protein
MVTPEAPENESLRIELQEALVSYRHWSSQFTQATGFLITADVVLLSYGFSQRSAAILLVASVVPLVVLVYYMAIDSFIRPLITLILSIERSLLIQKDSLGAVIARTYLVKITPGLGSRIEDLTNEEVRHLNFKREPLRSAVPIALCAATLVQIGLSVLGLTVFHYRFM